MGDFEVIRAVVERVARRRCWRRAWTGLWGGVLAGGSVWLGAVVCHKVLPLPESALVAAALVAALMLPLGFGWGWSRRESLMAAARWIDRREQSQERLSTAWELAEADRGGAWRELLIADAARHMARFELGRALPFSLPRWAGWIVMVLALGAGLGFVPEHRGQGYLEQRRAAEVTQEAGERLASLTARQLEVRPPTLERTEELLMAVQELGVRLGRLELNRDQSLRELANVSERLREELASMGRKPALRRLEAGNRTEGAAPGAVEALQRQAEALQEQLGRTSADARAAESLKLDMDALRQAAANLPAGDSAAAREARAQLAQAMAELAREAEALGVELPQLEEAIGALRAGELDQMLSQLQMAAIDLEQLAKMSKALGQLRAQLAEIGRDLAEQLEKGQGWPALATLRRMQDRLERGDPTEDELRQIMEEVGRSVAPGSQYGRVGEHLAAAVRGMTGGDRMRAAESLGEAAAELRRLMNQLGDGEELIAALGNLQTAQMCVGNGQGWGACRGQAAGFRPGGRPGSGVGTWADEGITLEETPSSELWDNSGITRPDQDARGTTDRGEGRVSEALVPTRVRGQISPGGSMPAVTLRGLSVRGQSRVSYREVVSAAQVEAQSALSQERVPRAYRGAVREYFDDLKE